MEVVYTLAADMLILGNASGTLDEARSLARSAVTSGRAFDVFRRFVRGQGGDLSAIDDPHRRDDFVPVAEIPAPRDGFVTALEIAEEAPNVPNTLLVDRYSSGSWLRDA